jgi:YcaO-like protein with predicted kinase domain
VESASGPIGGVSCAGYERYRRSGPPAATALVRLLRVRSDLGITRIADITGLDRLGLPVTQVVRPFSLSNSVSQGKGPDRTSAGVSAILESAESFFAERVSTFDVLTASARDLAVPAHRFAAHLLDGAGPGWGDLETEWVIADNLLGGEPGPVPLELVHTAYSVPPLAPDGLFAASTTGLAAAFAEQDAILHGTLEVIERDAVARANRVHGFFQKHRIALETIDDPLVCDLLERLRSRSMLVGLWHAPSPSGIPVVWCQVMEENEPGCGLLPYPADGSAASFDPAAAVAHSIYEAAQTRLAAISGARDDITRASYPSYPDWERIQAHRRLLAEGRGPVDFRRLRGRGEEGSGLPVLLSALSSSGISDAWLVRIDTSPVDELAAVKVVIPDLLPLFDA